MIEFIDALQLQNVHIAFIGSESEFLSKIQALPKVPRSSTNAEVSFFESPQALLTFLYSLDLDRQPKILVWGFWSHVDLAETLRCVIAIKNSGINSIEFGEDAPLSSEKGALLAEVDIHI